MPYDNGNYGYFLKIIKPNTLKKMTDLEKLINTESGEMPVKDFFKECLREVLVNNPPKRFLGDSSWWHTLSGGLAKAKLINGKVRPCCDLSDLCDGEHPCSYDYEGNSEEVNKGLRRLIDLL